MNKLSLLSHHVFHVLSIPSLVWKNYTPCFCHVWTSPVSLKVSWFFKDKAFVGGLHKFVELRLRAGALFAGAAKTYDRHSLISAWFPLGDVITNSFYDSTPVVVTNQCS